MLILTKDFMNSKQIKYSIFACQTYFSAENIHIQIIELIRSYNDKIDLLI